MVFLSVLKNQQMASSFLRVLEVSWDAKLKTAPA
jgi:hypothetical protein